MILTGKTKAQVEAEKLEQAKQEAIQEINRYKGILLRKGFNFNGETYPLDIGAQVAYQALQTAITTGIQETVLIITADNKIIEMDSETFNQFLIQALQKASEIAITARETKDAILIAKNIAEVQSLKIEFCKLNNLNSDLLDNYHAGNNNYNIPINNGTLNSNLNADMVDGYNASQTPTANTIPVAGSDGKLNIDWISAVSMMSKTFYVDAVNGNDNNTGSQSSPFLTLQKAFDSIPVGGRGSIILLSNVTLTADVSTGTNKHIELNTNNRKLSTSVCVIANAYVLNSITIDSGTILHINLGDNGILETPSIPTDKPLSPMMALLNFQETCVNAGIYFWIGSRSGTSWAEIKDNTRLVSIRHWSNSKPSGIFIGLYPHYNRILNLYGTNSFFVDFQGAVGGIYSVIDNSSWAGYIKRNGSNILLKDAIAGIIRDTNGVPRNVTSNIIL